MFTRIPPALQAALLPSAVSPNEFPPFWDLEDLIASGLDRASALDVLAMRRAEAEAGRSPALQRRTAEPSAYLPISLTDLSDSIV